MKRVPQREWYEVLLARADLAGLPLAKGVALAAVLPMAAGPARIVVGPESLFVNGWLQADAKAPAEWPWVPLTELQVIGPLPAPALQSYVEHDEQLRTRSRRGAK